MCALTSHSILLLLPDSHSLFPHGNPALLNGLGGINQHPGGNGPIASGAETAEVPQEATGEESPTTKKTQNLSTRFRSSDQPYRSVSTSTFVRSRSTVKDNWQNQLEQTKLAKDLQNS